nr:retrovirus-related Pol polyprotein from transposon TNT 1-94 [Tanacetum cinerariifolium]
MLDRTDFASWQQRIRLYCRGKKNEVNILKSIDERPYQMRMIKETLAEGEEGALHLGSERARVYSDLSPEDKERFVTAVKLNRGLKESTVCLFETTRARNCTQPKQPQNSEYFKNKMLLMQAQENGVVLDEEQLLLIAGGQDNIVDEDVDEPPVQDLALNANNVFQVDECDAFDSNVYEAPNAHTMFMANLSSTDPVYDEAGCPMKAHTKVVDASLTAKLATYKKQVELYERRAKFELTKREQTIEEQLKIVITDHNMKEENLKKELYSVKMQLNSTINHNKLMVEEVTSLKKDFKQKENKYLEEFLDMKALKEKVEDKLFKQD